MANELAWARYNSDVIKQTCLKCGAMSNQRCKGPNGGWVPAHIARIQAAGYRWSVARKELERV